MPGKKSTMTSSSRPKAVVVSVPFPHISPERKEWLSYYSCMVHGPISSVSPTWDLVCNFATLAPVPHLRNQNSEFGKIPPWLYVLYNLRNTHLGPKCSLLLHLVTRHVALLMPLPSITLRTVNTLWAVKYRATIILCSGGNSLLKEKWNHSVSKDLRVQSFCGHLY